jgi:proton-dependent oligopeptide transporter, POT family
VTAAADALPAPSLMGHPTGLFFLSFTEAWERFSFYGMQALLTLYMVKQLLLPGHIDGVIGMEGFRSTLEGVFGPLSTQALSSQIFGLYTGFVYLTPLFGGWIGDQVLGQRRTVLIGALMMAAGHLMMAFEASFLLALLMLIMGSGCLKGNISAQVGALYTRDDPRRTPAFALFNLGINIGAFVAPLVCGTIGELYGWHYGFSLAALGMLVGIAIYLAGSRHLPPDTLKPNDGEPRPKLQSKDVPILLALVVVLALGTFFATSYNQEFNVFPLWALDHTDRHIFGLEMPVTWFAALDGLFCVTLIPLAMRYWSYQANRGSASSDLTKIGWGNAIGALGMLCLVAASMIAAGGEKPGVGWSIACFALFAWGFVYNWPITLALCSRVAPPAIGGVIMGVAVLTNFVSNYTSGFLGAYYEQMTPVNFWAMHAAICAAGAVLTWVLFIPLNRALNLAPQTPP